MHDAFIVRHLEAEMAVRITLHFHQRHVHQLVAHMVEVADLEFAAPEFRVQ